MNRFTRLRALLAVLALTVSAVHLAGCVPLVAAGVGTGVAATLDRRSYGTQLEDTEIEVRSTRQINQRFGDKVRISTTSFNRWVLLTGQVPDEASKAEAERLVRSVPNVRQVYNEITVGWPASFGRRTDDGLLTTKVKTRLLDTNNPGVSGHHVKVVSETGAVYLMGLVTQQEAAAAINIARSTSGVQKVVDIFEIVTAEEARRLTPSGTPASTVPPAGNTQ